MKDRSENCDDVLVARKTPTMRTNRNGSEMPHGAEREPPVRWRSLGYLTTPARRKTIQRA
jgi:hypothetical protein